MRFAYIDSQGKEVAIPSVDALQLRIELGAITGETMFFDENTDKWAPASEHEIFRTLSRELKDQDEDGFVAPPPPTMVRARPPGAPEEVEDVPAPTSEAAEEAVPTDAAGATPVEEETVPGAGAESPSAEEPEEAEAPAKPKAPDPFAMEEGPSQAADSPEVAETAGVSAEADQEDADLSDFGQIDPGGGDDVEFGPVADAAELEGLGSFDLVDSEEEEEAPAYEGDDSFDFGDFGGAVSEEEEGDAVEEAEDAEEAPSFAFEGELELEEEEEEEAEEEEQDEGAAAVAGVADDSDSADEGLALEAPLSEYSPDRPPSWMGDEEEETQEGWEMEEEEEEEEPPARAAARGSADDGAGGDDERRSRTDRPAPRARPERPRRKKKGAGTLVLGVVALAALGGGGWFGWNYLQNREAQPVEEVVEIPEIPAALLPTLEAAASPAYQATVDSLRSLAADFPPAPDEDWLGGRYLANASQHVAIAAYWEGFEELLVTVRQSDHDIFMMEFEERLDSLGVTGDDRAALVDRASAGFRAARPDRAVVYDRLQTLVDASLDLHDFLEGNEAAIDYSPSASGLSADPVTEAVPATEALGEEMWDRVRDITRALDDLGALEERVGTERLLDAVFGQVRNVPIR